jgi:hypothetical protein
MYDGLFPGIQQAFPHPPRQHCPGRITADVAGDSLIFNALSRAEGKSILGKLGLDSILYSYVVGPPGCERRGTGRWGQTQRDAGHGHEIAFIGSLAGDQHRERVLDER